MLELLSTAVKALGYAASLGGAGAVLARASLTPDARPLAATATLVRTAGLVLAFCACASAVLLWQRLGGGLDGVLLQMVFLSPLGAALAMQLVGGLWVAANVGRTTAIAGAVLILLAFGVVGHSAARGMLTSATVLAHVATAAWWFGGLCVLLIASCRLPVEAFSTLLDRFSRQAIWMVTVLFGAALLTAALLVEFRLDPQSTYQQGLLAKLALTAGLVALAGLNKLMLAPRLKLGAQHRPMIQRSIAAELALFAGVMVVTAWLTSSQSPH